MECRSLFVSDVDNTLIGDDAGLEALIDWYLRVRNRLRLVLNSGRFFDSLMETVREKSIPMPDAIIGGVGTQIHFPASGRPMDDWPLLNGHWNANEIRKLLDKHDELTIQPQHLQSEHKISFYGNDLTDEFLRLLQQQLQQAGFQARLVYSSRRDLDVLPRGIDKGSAIIWLARYWGIDPGRVIVAGDSGNDLAMFQHGFYGITPANAHAELRQLADNRVYHAEQSHAAGVLEGLLRWYEQIESATESSP